MDSEELKEKLKNFQKACNAYSGGLYKIYGLELEDAYPGITPRIFIVKVHVNKELLNAESYSSTLKKLIELLYASVSTNTLKSILTLRLCRHTNELDLVGSSQMETHS